MSSKNKKKQKAECTHTCNFTKNVLNLLAERVVAPFHATGFFLYPLKTLENRGYRKRPVGRNKLNFTSFHMFTR